MHLHFIVHTHAHKNHVIISSVSEAQICNSFYYNTDKCIGQWHRGSTTMHGIPDPRGSLVNEILFHTIEQANQGIAIHNMSNHR